MLEATKFERKHVAVKIGSISLGGNQQINVKNHVSGNHRVTFFDQISFPEKTTEKKGPILGSDDRNQVGCGIPKS